MPPPSPWPWIAGAIATGALTLAVVRWGRAAVLATAAGVLAVTTLVEAAGSWADSTSSLVGKLGDLIVPAIGWTLLVAATTQLRRARRQASLLVGGAAAGLAWMFGVSDWSWLFASQLPTSLTPGIARAAIVTALAVGTALTVNAALDARQLLVASPAPPLRPTGPALPLPAHPVARWSLIVMLILIGVVFMIATAPPR